MDKNHIETIKERIAKLRKHAESADKLGSQEEAATFAAKATELLLEYNLLESDIKMGDNINRFKHWKYSERLSYKCNQSGQRAKLKLVKILCSHNLCDYVWRSGPKTFEVYGNMENVDQVVWLYNYLSVGLLRLAQQAHVEGTKNGSITINRYSFLKNFLIGAASGIDNQLKRVREANIHSSNINALIKVNNGYLEKFLEEDHPNIKGVKSRIIIVGQGYIDGIEAGENYSINKPLEQAQTEEQKLITI